MSTIPTECEVALLSLRASTSAQCRCDDCQQHAARLRQLADQDAARCRVALTQLVQRELSILCTDAFFAARETMAALEGDTDAEAVRPEQAEAAGLAAAATLSGIYRRLHTLLDRAITPSEKAQEWLALHIDGDTPPGELCREITASDCTLGRLEP